MIRSVVGAAVLLLAVSIPANAAQPLTVSVNHAPSHFLPGMIAAYATITVTNPGRSSATGTVTVSDTLPAGLTATAVAGEGWTCTATTCQRSDALPPRSSYPPIRVVVNVAADVPDQLVNTVTVNDIKRTDVIPARDACPNGWAPEQTISYGRSDSGVRNPQRADGCTLQDVVWNAEPFRGKADFLSTVDKAAAQFRLNAHQRLAVLAAAARSDVGTKPQIDNSCDRRIAFTFDDGTSIYRPELLKTLREKQVHGVFFDNGVRVEANPQWARFQAREGHVELNHTYSHVHMDQLTPEQNREEGTA
ncbi:polysaccharide deacetylase family protein [Kibdelosporangium philippinense]|uniref:Polysaccharide deacetylase family protein n=1 Tax=Kibdelosporangium philippinense TaxID=211113 RepID=A0ABS8ZHF1_9PSEU|nr:polysaccharide deacetylase family protein [Kibdelosporangium philippinense]MCE7007253.1 polysaccharide deacetylase family protein [Kibdelosporangium philippinense]